MNIYQGANAAATFLILSAIVAGMANHFHTAAASPIELLVAQPEVALLGLFLIVFRIKTLLDDHKYFAEPYQDKSALRYFGFVLAVVFWVFLGIAGYLLPFTIRSSEILAASILVSTLWAVTHIIEINLDKGRRNSELVTCLMREKWIAINVLYMLLLVAHVGWFRPIVAEGSIGPLLLLLAVLVFDVFTSRSTAIESQSVSPPPADIG